MKRAFMVAGVLACFALLWAGMFFQPWKVINGTLQPADSSWSLSVGTSGPIVSKADCSGETSGLCIDSDDHKIYRYDSGTSAMVEIGAGGTDEIIYQADCSGITNGICYDTDNGNFYYWDGDSVEQVTAGGDMLKATYDADEDGDIDPAAGGLGADLTTDNANKALVVNGTGDGYTVATKMNATGTAQDEILVSGADPYTFAPVAIAEQEIVGRVTGGHVDGIPIDDTPEDSSAKVASSKAVYDQAAALRFKSLAVADLGDATTPSVLTATETTNTCISNYKASGADHVFTLPAAHINGNVIFMVGDEFQVDIEPASGAALYLNGTAMAADEHIQNTSDTLGTRIVGFVSNINGTLTWMFYSGDAEWVEATP